MGTNPPVTPDGTQAPSTKLQPAQLPHKLLNKIRSDPTRTRQVLKAIYLFPTKTIGGQLVHSAIGLVGIFASIAYVNLALFIANRIQYDVEEHVGLGRRIFLLVSLGVAAFGCGYVRSKMIRSYLGINFFMVVSMFALIRGINNNVHQFANFIYPMCIGCCVSLAVSFVIWPEDRGSKLRSSVLKALKESKDIIKASRQGLRLGVPVEISISKITDAEKALGTCLDEANYEISISRVEPDHLVPFHQCLARLITNVRVLNAAMRRYNRTMRRLSVAAPAMTPGLREMEHNSETFRDIIYAALSCAINIMESMEKRVNDVFDGKMKTPIEHEKFQDMLVEFAHGMSNEVRNRDIEDYHELECAAFTDQLNTVILDMLDVVRDMTRAIAIIDPARRIKLVFPRKMRSGQALKHALSQIYGHSDEISVSQARSMMAADEAYVTYLEATTRLDRIKIWLASQLSSMKRSRHLKYAVKFTIAMCILAAPAYIARWYIWFDNFRAQLAMISAMVALETTRGMSFRTAGMKLIGAATGGLTAFLVVVASHGHIGISMGLTVIVGILVGCLVTNTKWQKTGTVTALAYNLVLGVGTIFRAQAPISAAFARRLLTLPVGLSVALIVHLTVFPYHSRGELVKGLGSSLDWLHHLLFAIECSEEHPQLQSKFDEMVGKAQGRVALAKSLMPATHYEFSLTGHWPYERFERIADKISDVIDLIVGETPSDPVLAVHLQGARTCERLRTKLLASLCNDLLVISHTLSARLHMPRHSSVSVSVLEEYQLSVLTQLFSTPLDLVPTDSLRNYCELGRLADLVSEMSLLRDEVDELTLETQCPKHGLLAHLSYAAKRSRSGSRPGSRSTTPAPGAQRWEGRLNASNVFFPNMMGDEEMGVRRGREEQDVGPRVRIMFESDVRGHVRDVSRDSDDSEETVVGGEEGRGRREDDMV
ncbi:hypothetical protein EX30DRAFT_349606 [Ascodesmis nigricans]|uniref:Putative ER transporter 6TM N-terminal domain-containing protein n=1 Tax=Ascodesmis nigricans TaxID=341454 RepID=A0A4V3SIH6_9PEZI|nr:hypothetical protein EX30DRAFT_349606 [Ascodesmis nigricans]